jgi:hypothetical protein
MRVIPSKSFLFCQEKLRERHARHTGRCGQLLELSFRKKSRVNGRGETGSVRGSKEARKGWAEDVSAGGRDEVL